MHIDSLAFRLTISWALLLVVVLSGGGFLLSQSFRDAVQQSFDNQLLVHLDDLLAGTTITRGGRLELQGTPSDQRFQEPYSGWYWQIENNEGEVLLRSRSLWDKNLAYNADDFSSKGNLVLDDQSLRYVSHDVFLSDLNAGVRFILTGASQELDRNIRRFNVILFLSIVLLGVFLAVGIFMQVRYGLRPLRSIGRDLSLIREGKRTHLQGQFPTEVQPLADEINALLDHNRDLVEHARHHVGNLAHALRTPLAVLMGEARQFLASRKNPADAARQLARAMERNGTLMTRYVEHHLARARMVARRKTSGEGTSVRTVVDGLCNVVSKIYHDKKIEVDIRPQDLQFHGERGDLEEILGNLLENACKWAKSRVRFEARMLSAKQMHIVIEDDGVGLQKERREEVFARGKRLDEMTPGSGLGLSIVREAVQLYEGEITLDDSEWGGLAVVLRLPLLKG